MGRPSPPQTPGAPFRRITLAVVFANLMVFTLVGLSLEGS